MTHSLCTATSSLEKSERLTDNLLLALGCQNFIGLTFYFHNRILLGIISIGNCQNVRYVSVESYLVLEIWEDPLILS